MRSFWLSVKIMRHMPFAILRESTPEFTRYTVSGSPSIKNYFDLIDGAARESAAGHEKLLLVDLRAVGGRLSFTDQFFIGDVIGDKLTHVQKLAVLVAEDPDSYNSPKVAQRKGVNIQAFASEEEAVAWLTEEARGKSGS